MEKNITDIIELWIDVYESHLSKAIIDIPLKFMDKKANKCIFKKFPDISEEKNKRTQRNKILNKDVDKIYLA